MLCLQTQQDFKTHYTTMNLTLEKKLTAIKKRENSYSCVKFKQCSSMTLLAKRSEHQIFTTTQNVHDKLLLELKMKCLKATIKPCTHFNTLRH